MQAASDAMPTLEQVEHEVLAAEGELAAAKAKKDYRRAAELSMKLPAMHDRHSAVASAIRNAMNRKQLAEETQRLEGEVYSKFLCCFFSGLPSFIDAFPPVVHRVVLQGLGYFSRLFSFRTCNTPPRLDDSRLPLVYCTIQSDNVTIQYALVLSYSRRRRRRRRT